MSVAPSEASRFPAKAAAPDFVQRLRDVAELCRPRLALMTLISVAVGFTLASPIVFRGPNGAAAQVSSQHSHCVEALYGNLPGFKVVAPSNAYDAKGLMKSAIRDNDPVYVMENTLLYGEKLEVPEEEYTIPLGVADIKREGGDVTLIAH